jgi:hypothetical protein
MMMMVVVDGKKENACGYILAQTKVYSCCCSVARERCDKAFFTLVDQKSGSGSGSYYSRSRSRS